MAEARTPGALQRRPRVGRPTLRWEQALVKFHGLHWRLMTDDRKSWRANGLSFVNSQLQFFACNPWHALPDHSLSSPSMNKLQYWIMEAKLEFQHKYLFLFLE